MFARTISKLLEGIQQSMQDREDSYDLDMHEIDMIVAAKFQEKHRAREYYCPNEKQMHVSVARFTIQHDDDETEEEVVVYLTSREESE